MALGFAVPRPAMSNAVPWAGVVTGMGNPAAIAAFSVAVIWAALQLDLSRPMIVGHSMQPRAFPAGAEAANTAVREARLEIGTGGGFLAACRRMAVFFVRSARSAPMRNRPSRGGTPAYLHRPRGGVWPDREPAPTGCRAPHPHGGRPRRFRRPGPQRSEDPT